MGRGKEGSQQESRLLESSFQCPVGGDVIKKRCFRGGWKHSFGESKNPLGVRCERLA